MHRRFAVCLGFLTLLTCVIGCGRSSELRLFTVTGIVTLDGKPVPNAIVTFKPKLTPSTGKLTVSQTDENGKFTLQTGDRPGAATATYVVTVFATENQEVASMGQLELLTGGSPGENLSPREPQQIKLLVPEKYTKPDLSGLEYFVAETKNYFEIELSTEVPK